MEEKKEVEKEEKYSEILLNYLKNNIDKFPKEKLKEEALKKGYTEKLFEDTYKKVSIEKNKPISTGEKQQKTTDLNVRNIDVNYSQKENDKKGFVEANLETYIRSEIDKFPKEKLKEEALKKGYNSDLFEIYYNRISNEKFRKPVDRDVNKTITETKEVTSTKQIENRFIPVEKKQSSSTILEEYIKKKIPFTSKEELKKEAISKGYGEEIFEEVYRRVYIEKDKPEPKAIRKDGKDYVLVPIEKEEIKKALEKTRGRNFFQPTQISVYIFCIILIATSAYSISKSFSYSSFSYQTTDQEFVGKASAFELGYPWVFIKVSAEESDPFSFFFWSFMGDFFLYLLISYIIDILIVNSFYALKDLIKREIKD